MASSINAESRTTAAKKRVLYVCLLLWIALSMGYYLVGVAALYEQRFNSSSYPGLPFEIHDNGTLYSLGKEAKQAGLQEGDRLQIFNDKAFAGDYQVTDYLAHAKPGDWLHVGINTKRGEQKTATLRLPTHWGVKLSPGLVVYYLLVVGVPLLSLLVGYWVVAAKPANPNAWLVLCLMTFWEASFADIQPAWWGGVWYTLFGSWGVLAEILMGLPTLLWFGIFFPERSRIDRRFPALKWIVLAVQAACCAYYLCFMYRHSFDAAGMPGILHWDPLVHAAYGWAGVASILIFLLAIFDKLRTASTPDAKRRLRVLAMGSAFSLGPVLIMFGVLPYFGPDPHHGALFEITTPFLVLFPLTLAYVLVVHRAMDVRVLLRMGTKYALAQVSVYVLEIIFAGLVVWFAVIPLIEATRHQTTDRLIAGILIALLIWAFTTSGGLGSRLQHWIDRKFFREAYEAELVLSELSEYACKLPDRERLIETVARRISEVLHVPQVSVWLRASAVFRPEYALGFGTAALTPLPESSATVGNLARANRATTVYRDRPDEWLQRATVEERNNLDEAEAELLLPLPGRNRLLGVMTLGAKRSEEPYTPTDLRVLQSVATQTGLALEVNELAKSLAEEAAQRARIDRELEIAHEVQERLFPQILPAVAEMSLAGHCRPAQGVGGDYYDVFELDDGRLGFAIGDVSGKGISAALLMASLRAFLRTLAYVGSIDLATLMQKMNHLVYESSAINRYATFFFALFDPATGTLDYVNAGHNPPLLLRHGQGCFERLRLNAGGPPVGLLPVAPYREQRLRLEAGDLLLAYTDGISEAQTRAEEEWGEERLFAVTEQYFAAPASELLAEIFRAADRFTGNAPQHDDMTLLIAKLAPGGTLRD